jgi:hypothetical protein
MRNPRHYRCLARGFIVEIKSDRMFYESTAFVFMILETANAYSQNRRHRKSKMGGLK